MIVNNAHLLLVDEELTHSRHGHDNFGIMLVSTISWRDC